LFTKFLVVPKRSSKKKRSRSRKG